MLGPSRSRQGSTLPYRIPLWGAILIVGTVLYLDNSPMQLEPTERLASGERLTRTQTADIVCVLDYRQIANSDPTFRDRDWSAAWIGMLEQHVGPIAAVTPQSLSAEHLESASAVVLTASVSDQIPDELAERLRQYALDGDLLVIERPEDTLREMFAANGRAGVQTGREITFARGIQEPYESQLTDLPLDTEYVGSTSPREGAETLLAIDGAPGIYAATVGDGTVVTVEFDLGEQLVALQQGRPTADFRVETESSEPSRQPPKTHELVADEALRGSEVPYADLLERYIVHGVLQRYAPVPTLWPFPGDAAGVVVPVHSDRELGDRGGWMLEYEASRDATSTLLSSVDSGLTAAGAAVIDRRGGEIGLLWRRAGSPAQRTDSYGLWGLEPVARPMTLHRQVGTLRETLPEESVTSVRAAGGWWSRSWDRPLRAVARENIPLDLSYRPREKGFAFGTGFPFRVFERSGAPLPVRELPIVVPGHASESFDIETLLGASRNGHHQVLTYSLAPASFGDYPDLQRFEQWVESFTQIRRNGHVIRNAREFLAFWRGRLDSQIESSLIEGVEVPDDDPESAMEEPERGSGDGLLLRIQGQFARNDLSIAVPESIGDRSFQQARRRASRSAGRLVAQKLETQRKSMVGYSLRRLPVESGSSRIDIYYR